MHKKIDKSAGVVAVIHQVEAERDSIYIYLHESKVLQGGDLGERLYAADLSREGNEDEIISAGHLRCKRQEKKKWDESKDV